MLEDTARRLVGIVLAALPKRYWDSLDRSWPVSSSALPASLLTLLAGAAIGLRGFLAYAGLLASQNVDAMLKAASDPTIPEDAVTTAMPVALNALAIFFFLFLTPTGLAAMYLGLTGLLRTAGAALDDPHGDPLLSLVERGVRGFTGARRTRRAQEHRESLEGPEVPDRVVPGESLGLPDAQVVIVSARRKPDWDKGTIVVTETTTYRVGDITERTLGGRLRTIYPLTEHTDLEVFRRVVHYTMPIKPSSR